MPHTATGLSLDSLPLLVLDGIVGALCPHCTGDARFRRWETPVHPDSCGAIIANTRALASLAATCRALYAVANPSLYHQPQCRNTQRINLLRTLVGRPDLARRVKVLRLDFDDGRRQISTDGDWAFVLDLAIRHHDWSVVNHATDRASCYGDYEGTQDDLPSNLLIAECPNLETLGLVLGYGINFAPLRPASLPHLRDVYVTAIDPDDGLNLGLLKDLYPAAPAMQSFTSNLADDVSAWAAGTPYRDFPLGNLRHLRIQMGALSSRCLRVLLRSCPELESFTYQAGCPGDNPEQFTPDMVRRMLPRYVPQLKHLDLNLWRGRHFGEWGLYEPENDPANDPDPGPGFTALSHLETLAVDTLVLKEAWGEEQPLETLFPESLRSLTVTVMDLRTEELGALKAFAVTARIHLPNMTYVEIRHDDDYQGFQ